ncbi:FadR/GntR family transcriptional regulator [Telmatospirillum siberiense]|uniref:HTH gntR-type domain-containing protein n=1 Tax=Telmatospirillum siberiense TaxID=382514 RepID=A0A2N3PQN8_9PROT|nr:FCD domain-containing protein [Telmatospirillum siberiense]PKU22708.1 hypothetical protein CWS72_20490 [Telmatospirillum siberiense]
MAVISDSDLLERVKSHFISQGLKPGDKVEGEVSLAERFGVSRHHIRKALTVMVQAGILERATKRGTIIRDFDANTLSEHIRFQFEVAQFDTYEFKEARVVVERAILPLAVRRITPVGIAKVEECIELMLKHQDEPEKADNYDRDFHLQIFRACGNQVLSAFSGVLSTLFRSVEYRRQYWTHERITRIADEHRLILEAIKRGDALAAVAALDAHLGYSKLSFSS